MGEAREGAPRAAPSYAGAALRGSAWTTLQVAVNKVAAAVATVALGYFLTAEDFGVAWFAVSAGQLALLLPVAAVIDVLIAAPRRFGAIAAPSARLAWGAGAVQAAVIVLVGLALGHAYPDRRGLAAAMALVALRPVSDAAYAVTLAGMRIRLDYRPIAFVDCVSALCSSALSVLLALTGAGPVAIVLPPTVANVVRGALYRRSAGPLPVGSRRAGLAAAIFRRFRVAALASYVGGALLMIELVALGACASTRSVGLFAFASGLASQLNSVVAFQASSAIQPIMGHLSGSPERQVQGALRATRMLAALLVPALLAQAAVGGPLIRTLWPGKWDEAVLVFAIVSVSQSLCVCHWPSVFVLKAQGRFRACLRAQVVNLVIAAAMLPVAALAGPALLSAPAERIGLAVTPDSLAPTAVALASAMIAGIFSPLMLWLACRPAGIRWPTVLDAALRPFVAAVPLGVAAHAAALHLEATVTSRWVALVSLLGLAAVASAAGALVAVSLDRSTRADASAAIALVRSWRFRRDGTPSGT